MLALQLLATGLVTGCALGVVAISFALVYATTKIFHVAHAGIYTLAGYLAWSLVVHNVPLIVAAVVSIAGCTVLGALIQSQLYARLERRRAHGLIFEKLPKRTKVLLALPEKERKRIINDRKKGLKERAKVVETKSSGRAKKGKRAAG